MAMAGLSVVFVLGSGREALAQDRTEKAVAPSARLEAGDRTRPDFSVRLRADGEHAFTSNVDEAGDVSITRATGELSFDFKIFDQTRMGLDWKSERSWYNFDGATGFAAGFDAPWGDTQQHEVGLSFLGRVDDNWGWFARGFVNSSFEDDADFGDSITGGGGGGAQYRFSDTFALSGGLLVVSRLEDQVAVFPLIGIDWKITDTLKLESRGLGARLSSTLSDAATLYLQGGYETRDFRLDDEGAAPGGVGRDRRVPIFVGLDYAFEKSVTLGLRAGVYAWNEYRLEDQGGVKLSELDGDPQPFVGLSVEVVF
jgi:hypothetical protein